MHEVISQPRERAILIALCLDHDVRWQAVDHLNELAFLANTAGAEVVERIIQERDRIDSAYFIGKGKAEHLASAAESLGADLLIFDDDLTPAQVRNLERLTRKKILDRSGLILDIFARRAKTREARTQVELAQLQYLLPRLTRQWTHLSRQVGGIGTRGPGETQLEVDRRVIRNRISALTRDLAKIKNQRQIRRSGRKDVFKVALVGYTNVGKSTLMNALTEADVFVENRLFATLDATVRNMNRSEQPPILLIDTVGFIRKLPHDLVASFMSTLEEAKEADALLHVVDVSHPQFAEQMGVVKDVLQQLQIVDKSILTVFNKVDLLEQRGLIPRLRETHHPSVFVSATKGLFLDDLRREIFRLSREAVVFADLTLDVQSSWLVGKLYNHADILHVDYEDHHVKVRMRAARTEMHAIEGLLKEQMNGEFVLAETEP